jgi:hypothetical protein
MHALYYCNLFSAPASLTTGTEAYDVPPQEIASCKFPCDRSAGGGASLPFLNQ